MFPRPDTLEFTALIVESNEFDVRRIIRASLASEFKIRWRKANDLVTARSILKREDIDIAVVDYWLREAGVLRLCQDVEAGRFCNPTPIILMTSESRDLLPLRARAPGFSGYLTKDGLNAVATRSALAAALKTKMSGRINEDGGETTLLAKPFPGAGEIPLLLRADEQYTLLVQALREGHSGPAQTALIELTAALQEIWEDIGPDSRDSDEGY